jgi:hypothetical protein
VSGNVGAVVAQKHAEALEDALRTNADADERNELLVDLERTVTPLVAALEAQLANA